MTTIGVSGIGSIGARHARVFAAIDGVEVVTFDAHAGADTIRERVGAGVAVAPAYDALLDRPLDGLVIATPDAWHADQAVVATGRGVPVLLEKPAADSVAAVRRIIASAGDLPVLVGYVLHHVGCMRRAAELIAGGAIGTPVSFHAMLGAYETLTAARTRFVEPEEGTLFADYSHEWDYLRWFIAPVAGGYALARTAGDLAPRPQPNVVDAVLRMRDGTTGSVHLDYVQQPGRRRCTVIGDSGTLDVDAATGSIRLRTVDTDRSESHPERRDDAFRAQALHFLDVIRQEVEPAVDLSAGLAGVAVAAALRRSAQEQCWVDVDDR